MTKGIFWLSALDQKAAPVTPLYDHLAKHFHITLQFGVELTPEIQEMLGEKVDIQVVADCHNERIQALRIELPDEVRAMCNNAIPHMTISMVEGVKPVESNDMLSEEHEEVAVSTVIHMVYDFFQFG